MVSSPEPEEDTYDALPRRNLPSNGDYDELITILPPKKKLSPQNDDGVYDLPTKGISLKNDDYDELPTNNNNNIVVDGKGANEDDDYDELKV